MSDHYGSDLCRGERNGEARGHYDRDGEIGVERRTATRADLLDAIAATCPHLPRAEVRHIFEAALEEMGDVLRHGEAVKLRSFGQFAVRAKRERVGRNPRTGVEVPITSRRVLTFRPSSVLLDRVNGDQTKPGAEE